MKINKKLTVLSVFAMLAVGVLTTSFTGAQNNTGGSGLLISPTRTEISGQPSEKKTFSITVKNVTNGNVKAQAFVNDFESDGSTGTPKIIVDETKEKTPYSIKSMITGLEDVDLKAGETKEVKFGIDIPVNVAPGAYFGAVRYAAVPEGQAANTGKEQVALTASVAHLVFVEVPGTVVQKAQITNVVIKSKDGKNSSIFKAPQSVETSVKNLGNGFSRPFGKMTITKGKTNVFTDDINNTNPKGIVLPNSTRTFSNAVKGVKSPGKYTVSSGVAYGNGGEVVNFQKSFWYLPIWFVITILLVLAIVIVGAWMMYKKASGGKAKRK